jgi:hypothetical protein
MKQALLAEAKANEMIESIYDEIVELHHHREIWEYLNAQLPKRGGSIINGALMRWYVDSQSAAVRRLASDRSQDKRSFPRLLMLVGAEPKLLKGRYSVIMSSEILKADLAALSAETANVARWADEKVAHMGRVSTANPTFNELDSAIDTLGRLLSKYYQLITGGGLPEVTPIINDDWLRPFTKPWF